jgi:hypothetical protein
VNGWCVDPAGFLPAIRQFSWWMINPLKERAS